MSSLPENDPQTPPKAIPFGTPVPPRPDYFLGSRFKSPLVATVLSIVPGLGQAYLGYTMLGFIHAISMAALFTIMASNRLGGLEPFAAICMIFLMLYNLVDAHRRAVLINESLARLDSPPLPEGLGTIPFGARIAAGIALMIGGTVAFLHIRFGFSLAWLEDWWPLGVVGFGLYLVVRAIQDRAAQASTHKN